MADTEREHRWIARAPGGSTASRWHMYRDCRALEMQRNADSLTGGEYGISDATMDTLRTLGIATDEGGMCSECKRRRDVNRILANTTDAAPQIHRGREMLYRWVQPEPGGPFEVAAIQVDADGNRWLYRHGSTRAHRSSNFALGPEIPWGRANDNEAEVAQTFQVQGTPEGARLIPTEGMSDQEAFTSDPPRSLAHVFEQIRNTWGAPERLRGARDKPSLLLRGGEVMGMLVMDEDISIEEAAQFGNWIKDQATVEAALNAILGTESSS